jgi:hypothetical protein
MSSAQAVSEDREVVADREMA